MATTVSINMRILIVGCVGSHDVVLVVLAALVAVLSVGEIMLKLWCVLSGFACARTGRRHRWKVVFGARARETQHGCCCCTFGALVEGLRCEGVLYRCCYSCCSCVLTSLRVFVVEAVLSLLVFVWFFVSLFLFMFVSFFVCLFVSFCFVSLLLVLLFLLLLLRLWWFSRRPSYGVVIVVILTVASLLHLYETVTRPSSGVLNCFNWQLLFLSSYSPLPHTEYACWCFLLLRRYCCCCCSCDSLVVVLTMLLI